MDVLEKCQQQAYYESSQKYIDQQAKLRDLIVVTDSDEESPANNKQNLAASKDQEAEDQEFTKEELSLCISPYQRYDHDFGTHHVRLKLIEQWKRAEYAKKELIPKSSPKSSRFPISLKSLKSGMTFKQNAPREELLNIKEINLDIASI